MILSRRKALFGGAAAALSVVAAPAVVRASSLMKIYVPPNRELVTGFRAIDYPIAADSWSTALFGMALAVQGDMVLVSDGARQNMAWYRSDLSASMHIGDVLVRGADGRVRSLRSLRA